MRAALVRACRHTRAPPPFRAVHGGRKIPVQEFIKVDNTFINTNTILRIEQSGQHYIVTSLQSGPSGNSMWISSGTETFYTRDDDEAEGMRDYLSRCTF